MWKHEVRISIRQYLVVSILKLTKPSSCPDPRYTTICAHVLQKLQECNVGGLGLLTGVRWWWYDDDAMTSSALASLIMIITNYSQAWHLGALGKLSATQPIPGLNSNTVSNENIDQARFMFCWARLITAAKEESEVSHEIFCVKIWKHMLITLPQLNDKDVIFMPVWR